MAKIASDIVSACMLLVADQQKQTFPRTDDVVISYISGLVEDEDEEMDDIVEMTRGMLQAGPSNSDSKPLDDL
jgi:ATP-binding cassette subfamily F protein 3